MKLDRNINPDGRGKYALIKIRRIAEINQEFGAADGTAGAAVASALKVLQSFGVIDWGGTPDREFFVMRLKDEYVAAGLHGYASAAQAGGDEEYAREITEMADRAGPNHPNCKKPD